MSSFLVVTKNIGSDSNKTKFYEYVNIFFNFYIFELQIFYLTFLATLCAVISISENVQ